MLEYKIKQIRNITYKISEFVDVINIIECNILLEQRLLLLKEIEQEVLLPQNKCFLDEFTSLIRWIAQIDKASEQKVVKLKSSYQEKLTKQTKTKFAIASYKKYL